MNNARKLDNLIDRYLSPIDGVAYPNMEVEFDYEGFPLTAKMKKGNLSIFIYVGDLVKGITEIEIPSPHSNLVDFAIKLLEKELRSES